MNNMEVYQITNDDAKRIIGSRFIAGKRKLPITNTSIVAREALTGVDAGEFIDAKYVTEAAKKAGFKESQCANATTLLLYAGYVQKTNVKAVYRVTGKHLQEQR